MEKVFIVDDHPVIISGLRALLEEKGGYRVTGEAGSISEAMESLCIDIPDYIIVDVELCSGINGIELVRIVRKSFPQVRIIVMSMDDGALYAERAIKAGARGFVSKADLADTIFNAIETVRSGEIYLSIEVCNIIAENHFRSYFQPSAGSDIANLTDREFEVFQLIGRGYKRDEIAERLKISANTVDVYRRKIRLKLSIPSTSGLTRFAIKHAAEIFNIQP
ncbi:MAG TPA: response regulator transcription factor [Spirochaetota bacterium]|nr:response regulator transcription factor [Spirochaetota bacterium]HPJ34367.1 response regulator transcription factor [Spirochaetota bacterium]